MGARNLRLGAAPPAPNLARLGRWARRLAIALLLPLVIAGCSFGDDETRVAEDRVGGTTASPTSLASLPEGIEEATIGIESQTFTVEQLTLQEAEPTDLHVVNDDDRAYRIRIVEDLVTETAVPANATTDISFTTPNAGRFEAELLLADGDEVVDTMVVLVIAPGGVQP